MNLRVIRRNFRIQLTFTDLEMDVKKSTRGEKVKRDLRLFERSLLLFQGILLAIYESIHMLTGRTRFYLEPIDSTAVDK